MNPLNPFSMEFQAAITHIGVRNVVSSINHKEIPSTPTW